MTWGEFKERVDKLGVDDQDELWLIEVMFPLESSGLRVLNAKEFGKGLAIDDGGVIDEEV